MAATSAVRRVELDPERAWALWTDLGRWATFVEGFGHVVEQSGDWPHEGSRVAWASTPGGRGRVTEKVTASQPGILHVTQVFEEALTGSQLVSFQAGEDGRTRVELRLDYRLTAAGPLKALADILFIRRALGQALARTLERFAAEAAEEAAR
jgi:uncharacterized membrane protein